MTEIEEKEFAEYKKMIQKKNIAKVKDTKVMEIFSYINTGTLDEVTLIKNDNTKVMFEDVPTPEYIENNCDGVCLQIDIETGQILNWEALTEDKLLETLCPLKDEDYLEDDFFDWKHDQETKRLIAETLEETPDNIEIGSPDDF